MTEIIVKGYKCDRCNYQWVPVKAARPRTCPKCRSVYWDIPRRDKPTYDDLQLTMAMMPGK